MEEGSKKWGKKVWRKAFVIYSTSGPFLINYTQTSKQGCRYSENQLNMSVFCFLLESTETTKTCEER